MPGAPSNFLLPACFVKLHLMFVPWEELGQPLAPEEQADQAELGAAGAHTSCVCEDTRVCVCVCVCVCVNPCT